MELFGESFLAHGPSDEWFAFRACPECARVPLVRVTVGDAPRWVCRACGHCHAAEGGTLKVIDPVRCPGCSTDRRQECIARLAATFPRFGTADV